jgi:ectoine hydroxylase-related dioxygenase (phytanoyl-CoA dioxygenase family)
MQWPSYISAVLQRFRTDYRMLKILRPLVGCDIKQVINTLVWKQPGSAHTSYAFHQDHRFRRPASAYRNLMTSFVQTAIAVDPHTLENGCLSMFRGSHLLGDLKLNTDISVYEGKCDIKSACAKGLSESDLVYIELDQGDVALWNSYTVHGSDNNSSVGNRRTYLNGYIRAADCDRGEWAFRGGMSCQIEEPLLVQYEDLYTRPEPHFVDGAPHPYTDSR